jgi:hypothetical protein
MKKKSVKYLLLASSLRITKCEQPKEDKKDAACGSYGKEDKLIQYFGRKTRRKGTIRKRRWSNNNKMHHLKEIKYKVVHWTHLSQQ